MKLLKICEEFPHSTRSQYSVGLILYFLIIELHPYQLPLSTGANEASVFFSCENETYTWCSIQLENTQVDSHETMEEYLMARNTNNNKKSEKSLDIKCGSVYATSMHVGQ